MPTADRLEAEPHLEFGYLYEWLDHTDTRRRGPARPEVTDPELLAAARLLNAVLPPALFLADLAVFGWLSLEAVNIWVHHGPARSLLSSVISDQRQSSMSQVPGRL